MSGERIYSRQSVDNFLKSPPDSISNKAAKLNHISSGVPSSPPDDRQKNFYKTALIIALLLIDLLFAIGFYIQRPKVLTSAPLELEAKVAKLYSQLASPFIKKIISLSPELEVVQKNDTAELRLAVEVGRGVGIPGSTGPAGPKGEKGDKGDKGSQGDARSA